MSTNIVNIKSVSVWWYLNVLSNTQATFEAQLMKKLSITDAELKKKKHYLLKRKHVPLTMLRSRRKQNEKARKRWKYWARDLFVKQEIHGEYHHLLPDLLSGSRNFFYFRYRRMNPERLELLLSLVKGKISKGNMKFITSILPRERLVLRI